MEAVPAVKWALGVAGVISAVALVKVLFSGDWVTAMLAGLVMMALMTLLVLFAAIARASSGRLMVPALVLTWAVLILVIACATLAVSSAFFDTPKPWRELIGKDPLPPSHPTDDYLAPVKEDKPVHKWGDEFVSKTDTPRHWTTVPAVWDEKRDVPKDRTRQGFHINGPGLVFSAPESQKFYDFHFTVIFQFLQEGTDEFSWGIRLRPGGPWYAIGKPKSPQGYLFNLKREVDASGYTVIYLHAYACDSIRTNLDWSKQDALPDNEPISGMVYQDERKCAADDNAKFQVTGDVRGYQFTLHTQVDRDGSETDPCKQPPRYHQLIFEDKKKRYPSGLFGIFAPQNAGKTQVSSVLLESRVE